MEDARSGREETRGGRNKEEETEKEEVGRSGTGGCDLDETERRHLASVNICLYYILHLNFVSTCVY